MAFPPHGPGRPGDCPRGSHRSGRAAFLHPVRQSTALLRDGVTMDEPRWGKRIPLKQLVHGGPRQRPLSGSPREPLVPDLSDEVREGRDEGRVPFDAKVSVVTMHFRRQFLRLLAHGPVPVEPTPIRDTSQRSSESVVRCPLLDHPVPFEGSRPVVREAEQVECPRFLPASTAVRWKTWRPFERYEPRLVWMKREAVPAEPLRQDFHHAASILFLGQNDHKVVRVSDQRRTPTQPWAHFPLEPEVEHFVTVDVRKQRRDDAALRGADIRGPNRPFLLRSRVEPLPEQSKQCAISYPGAEVLPQMTVVQRVEELSDIDLHHPAALHRHRRISKALQRL